MPIRKRAPAPQATLSAAVGIAFTAAAANIGEPPTVGLHAGAPAMLSTVLRHSLAGGVAATLHGAGGDAALRASMHGAFGWMKFLEATEFEKRLARMETWFDKHRFDRPSRY